MDEDIIFMYSQIYDQIMHEFPVTLGKAISKRERIETNQLDNINLTYSELPFYSIFDILMKIKNKYGKSTYSNNNFEIMQQSGGLFYDLGAGIGNILVAASIIHDFDLCRGFEVLQGLLAVSNHVFEMYCTHGRAHSHLLHRKLFPICDIISSSFLEDLSWCNGDVVFVNSTCFDEITFEGIMNNSAKMKVGAFLITLSRRIPSSLFQVIECYSVLSNWGEVSVFIMQKVQ